MRSLAFSSRPSRMRLSFGGLRYGAAWAAKSTRQRCGSDTSAAWTSNGGSFSPSATTLVDVVDAGQQVLEQRLAEHDHRGAAALQLAGESHEQQHVAQALLGIEQDALARDLAAIPRRLAELDAGRLGQALARLVGGKADLELAAHHQRDRKLDARPAVLGIERQRAAEAADRLVDAAEVAQAERQVEEALAVIAVDRDRLEVMLHRLVQAAGGAQRVAEIGMQRRIVGIAGERQAMMRDRGLELADQAQRHAEIVVQLGMIGPDCQQPQIRRDRFVQPAGAMRLRRQPQLLNEAVGLVGKERDRVGPDSRRNGLIDGLSFTGSETTSNVRSKHLKTNA